MEKSSALGGSEKKVLRDGMRPFITLHYHQKAVQCFPDQNILSNP